MRRVGGYQRPEEERPLSSGHLLLNPTTGQVFLGNRRVVLTSTEFQLLHLLMKNRGDVVPHQIIESNLWSD